MSKNAVMNMQVEGIKDLQDMLKNAAPNEVRNVTRAAVYALAGKTRDTMKGRVKKRSRDLEKSIYAIRRRGTRGSMVAEVRLAGTPHPHGLILEFGTYKDKPQPFIVPSVEQLRSGVTEFYRREVGKKLEAALRRKARKAAGIIK